MTTRSDPSLRILPFGILAVLLLLGGVILLSRNSTPLPVISQVQTFQLTNQVGKVVRAEDLQGSVWVANIIFTRCLGPCQKMTRVMEKLQSEFAGNSKVRFVSITADPGYDTPEVLRRFAERYHADPSRWHFLTGPKVDIIRVAVDDLKLTVVDKAERERENPEDLFLHSTISVVVDARGRLRTSVEALEPEGPELLRAAVRRLLAE